MEVGYKKRELQAILFILLGYPDSNQERQDQNLQCYHYTIAQSISGAKVHLFFFPANVFAFFLQKTLLFS